MAYDAVKFCMALSHAPYNFHQSLKMVHVKAILDAAEIHNPNLDIRFLSYMLATVLWETEFTMLPIREIGLGRGKAYGVRDMNTGQIYYGRGYVQTTWKYNYQKLTTLLHNKVNLVMHPDLLLLPRYAAPALFNAMELGIYTGKKLADYFHPNYDDPVDARRIINGLDHAHLVKGYYEHIKQALELSKLQLAA